MENQEITEESIATEHDETAEETDQDQTDQSTETLAPVESAPKPIHPNPSMPPWERLPEESTEAYAAFCIYRDLGRKRSVLKAWRLQGGCEGAVVPGRWNRWRAQHQWRKRVDYFDQEMERQRRAIAHEIEVELHMFRLKRQLYAQEYVASLATQLIEHVRTEIPIMPLSDRNFKREDGSEVILRGTSPGQLARLIQQVRDLEAALHHGFPKSGSQLW